VKQRHKNRRHPIDFVLGRLPFFQTFQLHFHESPRLAGLEFRIAFSKLSRSRAGHCNTCVIAGGQALRKY
jgi:hypothetical protein